MKESRIISAKGALLASVGDTRMFILLRASILSAFLFLFVALPLRAAEYTKAVDIIRAEGKFLTTDGSSYFLFNKDGTFDSGPLSMSGREIHGKWTSEDSQFVIEGKWGWINGGSLRNDRRRLTVTVEPPFSPETMDEFKDFIPQKGKLPLRAYKCYFTIEGLVKLTGK